MMVSRVATEKSKEQHQATVRASRGLRGNSLAVERAMTHLVANGCASPPQAWLKKQA